jgi:hypothetical protein
MFSSFIKICLFSVCFHFDSILILWTLAVKLCMAIGARPHMCEVFLMFVLTPADGLCCVWLIILSCVGSGARKRGITLKIGTN